MRRLEFSSRRILPARIRAEAAAAVLAFVSAGAAGAGCSMTVTSSQGEGSKDGAPAQQADGAGHSVGEGEAGSADAAAKAQGATEAGSADAAAEGQGAIDAAAPARDAQGQADAAADGGVFGRSVGGNCFPICAFPLITDPSNSGYGWEQQRSCLDPRSPQAATAPPCTPPPPPNAPPPGDGFFDGTQCFPACTSDLTAFGPDGGLTDYGYERGRSCIVPGTASALGDLPCVPTVMVYPPGNGVNNGTGCIPLCVSPAMSAPDGGAYGFENGATCVVSTSVPALQGIPCTAPNPPPPPPPPPAPTGPGWNGDYTATMFGQVDCAPLGVTDSTNLNSSTCVASRQVTLNSTNEEFYGAPGDLSTLWTGSPCTCVGNPGQTTTCGSPPACTGQADCGQCVEIACNGTGVYSFEGDGFTHDEFCKPNASVVVQIIDACPHNHPSNVYWCTAARPNHIDLSCSAFASLTQGRPIAQIGSINAYVRPVDCSVGLGAHTF
jgi:hypothetical protein